MNHTLKIENLHVSVDDKPILRGVNLGSKLTMKYPAVHMMETGARGEILSTDL